MKILQSYDDYLVTLNLPEVPLFTTDIDLWDVYLSGFSDPVERQYHNCYTCKGFIRKYGNLVTIDKVTGETKSAIWEPEKAPSVYYNSVSDMKKATESAKVKGLFVSSEATLGTSVTGEWAHFSVKNPNAYVKRHLTAGQYAAERKEDYRNVSRALGEFQMETLEHVTELLESDSLYRSEKVLGQAKWLRDLKRMVTTTKNQLIRKNKMWLAVVEAPAGFCHPRSSMIGTILEDLDNGVPFNIAAQKFKDKMHPLQYQRPTVPPTDGEILAAERLVKTLGVEKSLERRFATLEDMETIWTPAAEVPPSGGIFDHLKANSNPNVIVAPTGNITWTKFYETVLPKAKKIEVNIPSGRSAFITFTTALHRDAPVIFQWNNSVSWYFRHGGATAAEYGLTPGWACVKAVCFQPHMWGGNISANFGKGVSFIIDSAKESRVSGNALFPETLKAEFHGIRKVVEAHSKKATIHDIGEPHVIGKGIGSTIRVHTSIITEYKIDRWD